jgi:polyhydroxyalkanoate synthesis regulator phasin
MVMDALRGYVQLANGLTEVTRQRAQKAAKQLLQQTGAEGLTSGLTTKVSDLADEIVATSKSNRALLQAIVSNEVEGAVARLGFVRADEVAALRRRLEKLEQQQSSGTPAASAATAASPAASTAPAAKKAPVKKTAAKRSAAKKATATKTTATKATAKKSAGKKSAAAKKA